MTSRILVPCLALVLVLTVVPVAEAQPPDSQNGVLARISGIRLSQTGNTGLTVNVDVTAFYTTGAPFTTAYLGTYFNHVPAIDWGDGNTVPAFGYGPSTGIPLVATSTVVNGIPARAYRGSFSHTYASPGSYTIAANTSCCAVLTTPTYTLVSGTRRTTTFTTYTSFIGTTTTIINSFVQNTLGLTAVAPGFSKTFAPDVIPVGTPSTLTFTIDNTASTLDDDALAFTDNLPAGVVVANPANVVNTCGGTPTATSGSGTIGLSGGNVAAGAACTLSVDVTGTAPGAFVNTSGDLTSSFGNSGPASDTLTVTATAPSFTKAFTPTQILVGGTATLTFVIDNTANAAPATGLAFTDNLPAGMTVATVPNVFDSCGGTLTANPGAAVVSYASGSVGAGATCTISVDVTVASGGNYNNVADPLSSSLGSSPAGSATAALLVGAPAPDVLEVPTLSSVAMALLGGVLVLLALGFLRRLH